MKMKRISYLIISLCLVSLQSFASCSEDKDQPSFRASGGVSGTENGHNYVDLGLPSGTMWATTNVGASNPQDYGNCYAWGEISTKDKKKYSWENYTYGSDCNSLTKYCNNSVNGNLDNKTILENADDVAVKSWGGKWRMPTAAQQEELMSQCYWVWTDDYNGSSKSGYIVYKAKSASDRGVKVGKGNTASYSYSLSDNHIFLPSAGFIFAVKENSDPNLNEGLGGYYWSASLSLETPYDAWSIDFNFVEVYGHVNSRSFGQPVRPVFKP